MIEIENRLPGIKAEGRTGGMRVVIQVQRRDPCGDGTVLYLECVSVKILTVMRTIVLEDVLSGKTG